MTAFLASLSFITLAEMGDKTQLLAMAFASRYKAYQVLTAVFIATLLNHLLAVLAGRFLATIVPFDIISLLAALSFILFGIWTIRGDILDGEDKKQSKYGPIMTVAIAFFIAEMGDKTQLTTISLAVKYGDVIPVLFGTTAGMVIADAIGVITGVVMSKRIPERVIKWISAVIFIMFGFAGVYKSTTAWFDFQTNTFIIVLLIVITMYIVYLVQRNQNKTIKTCRNIQI
ncbi:MAG: TMEM165/GDT1 family protein [Elusimicrobia bacterium]|nr:TMEM165/GDT1 family protein [Candidatus Liberimonas magnetica]